MLGIQWLLNFREVSITEDCRGRAVKHHTAPHWSTALQIEAAEQVTVNGQNGCPARPTQRAAAILVLVGREPFGSRPDRQTDWIGSQTNGKLPWEGCKTSHSPPLVHGLKRADCGNGAKS